MINSKLFHHLHIRIKALFHSITLVGKTTKNSQKNWSRKANFSNMQLKKKSFDLDDLTTQSYLNCFLSLLVLYLFLLFIYLIYLKILLLKWTENHDCGRSSSFLSQERLNSIKLILGITNSFLGCSWINHSFKSSYILPALSSNMRNE